MDAVEEIKGRLSIEDVVQGYVDLKRTGSTYKGLCPFHQEKTPSFYVTPARNSYHCFGCGKGGDIFNFVMEMDKATFPEALKKLAGQAGVALPERAPEKRSLTNRLYEANQAAADFFHETLRSSRGRAAGEYLKQRDFDDVAVEQFYLGYAPDGREQLVHHLHQAGFDDRILLPAGLALQDDDGGKSRDRFRGRLMFPIRDRAGRIVGFGGRTLGSDVQPKYLNSPQTEIFDKSSVLYGIHRAQEAIHKEHRAVLVEGYLDTIRAHLEGYLYTVASLGTAITSKQLVGLSRLTESVTLVLDPDVAGASAAARASITALAEVTRTRGVRIGSTTSLDLRIGALPDGKGDPDEVLRTDPRLWEETLKGSAPAWQFYLDHLVKTADQNSDSWQEEVLQKSLPLIQEFAHLPDLQQRWVERVQRVTGREIRGLRSRPATKPRQFTREASKRADEARNSISHITSRAVARDPANTVEQVLIALLLQLVIFPTEAERLLQSSEFENPEHRAIITSLLSWQSTGNYDYEMLRETLPEAAREKADFLRSMEVPLPDDDKISLAITYHLTRLRHFRLQAQQARASQFLHDVDAEGKSTAVASLAQLIRERQEVEQHLDRLSRETLQRSAVQAGD